jgi:hypothetical protein
MDTASAYSGTPASVHLDNNLGASPFNAMPCRLRVAENKSPLQALNTEVMINALTRSARPDIFSRSMAMTYGDLNVPLLAYIAQLCRSKLI